MNEILLQASDPNLFGGILLFGFISLMFFKMWVTERGQYLFTERDISECPEHHISSDRLEQNYCYKCGKELEQTTNDAFFSDGVRDGIADFISSEDSELVKSQERKEALEEVYDELGISTDVKEKNLEKESDKNEQ